jgi:hypothetical protein
MISTKGKYVFEISWDWGCWYVVEGNVFEGSYKVWQFLSLCRVVSADKLSALRFVAGPLKLAIAIKPK